MYPTEAKRPTTDPCGLGSDAPPNGTYYVLPYTVTNKSDRATNEFGSALAMFSIRGASQGYIAWQFNVESFGAGEDCSKYIASGDYQQGRGLLPGGSLRGAFTLDSRAGVYLTNDDTYSIVVQHDLSGVTRESGPGSVPAVMTPGETTTTTAPAQVDYGPCPLPASATTHIAAGYDTVYNVVAALMDIDDQSEPYDNNACYAAVWANTEGIKFEEQLGKRPGTSVSGNVTELVLTTGNDNDEPVDGQDETFENLVIGDNPITYNVQLQGNSDSGWKLVFISAQQKTDN